MTQTLFASQWFGVALVMAAVFVLVYAWTRRPPQDTNTSRTTPTTPPTTRREENPKDLSSETVAMGRIDPDLPTSSDRLPSLLSSGTLPQLADDDDDADEVDATKIGEGVIGKLSDLQVPTKQIIYDDDAAIDEKTHPGALILVTGMAQTDKGLRRQRNEDSILVMPKEGVYVVADGMGGYRGGDIASNLAVKAIEVAFQDEQFVGRAHEGIPRRASELARAIQMANAAILRRAESERDLLGMGTTICAARFTSNKQRLYVGHVGDSRLYRFRNGKLVQLTQDHTMGDLGVVGEAAAHLSRAVGIWPTVPVDVLLVRPRPRDLYLLCSDGLSKMLSDDEIEQILHPTIPPDQVVEALIDAANAHGGKDNISAIVIRVDDAVTTGVAA